MWRGMMVRRIAAIALMAMYATFCMAKLAILSTQPFRNHAHEWVCRLEGGLRVALPLAASLGLVRRWWWARMFSASLAVSVFFTVVESSVHWRLQGPDLLGLAWVGAVLASLRGPEFLASYEGQRTADVDWRTRGMRTLRWAIVLNGATLVNASTLFIDAWQQRYGCFGLLPSIDHHASTYWPAVALAALLLLGLALMARQRTAGLLLTSVVSVAFPVVLVVYLLSFGRFGEIYLPVLASAVPGVLAAWTAVAVWVKPMLRLLSPRLE